MAPTESIVVSRGDNFKKSDWIMCLLWHIHPFHSKLKVKTYNFTFFFLTESWYIDGINHDSNVLREKTIWPITAQMTYNVCDSTIDMREWCVELSQRAKSEISYLHYPRLSEYQSFGIWLEQDGKYQPSVQNKVSFCCTARTGCKHCCLMLT